MTRLFVATRSRGKLAEFRALLEPFGVDAVFPQELGLAETAAEAELESHPTFEENARAKAGWFAAHSGMPALADDSGLEVDALGGAPGVHSKRFAGIDRPDHEVAAANNTELLRRLADVPDEWRTARYRCALVLSPAEPGGTELLAFGAVEGRILRAPRGDGGFGYDPLFFSDELRITFGEAPAAAKAAVSHRGRALVELMRLWRGER